MLERRYSWAAAGAQVTAAMLLLGCSREVTPWSEQLGIAGQQFVESIAVGPEGEVAVAGMSSWKIDLGDGQVTHPGGEFTDSDLDPGREFFVMVRDESGAPLWNRHTSTLDFAPGRGIAVAPTGDVLVSGGFFKFGDDPSGDAVTLLTRFDAKGTLLWSREFSPGGPAVFEPSLALGPDGSAVIGGEDPGGRDGSFVSRGTVAKFDANGDPVYHLKFGGAKNHVDAIAVDPSGAVLFAGLNSSSIELAGASFSSGGDSVIVGKLAPEGTPRWLAQLGVTGRADVRGIAVDPEGDVVVVGSVDGRLSFQDQDFSSVAGRRDAFIAKLSSVGVPRWFAHFGSAAGPAYANAVAIDDANHVFVTGAYQGKTIMGSHVLPDIGGSGAYLVELDGNGQIVAPRAFRRPGMNGESFGTALAIDPAGGIVVGGSFSGELESDGVHLTARSESDIFLLRLAR